MHPAIRVENIGKSYRLGLTHATSLRDLANGVVANLFGRRAHAERRDSCSTFWALRDVSFEIQPGEVVGVIGKNGAGKSTLLKILSNITLPDTGRAQIRGRVASLLEVGTGFHPELTGRENIFLNGAILGMTKPEIRRRFEQIVDFSGIPAFIDTPVKRYSSGMYVRLAFAVAAHLDPEILIVDEVLAVGDAQFQAKCLQKMQDSAKDARTVLFVSHNLHAISSLCSQAVLLSDGKVAAIGPTAAVVSQHLSSTAPPQSPADTLTADPHAPIGFTGKALIDRFGRPTKTIPFGESLSIALHYRIVEPVSSYRLVITLETASGIVIGTVTTEDASDLRLQNAPGEYSVVLRLPQSLLGPGAYFITAYIDRAGYRVFDHRMKWDQFTVVGNPLSKNRGWEGIIFIPPNWHLQGGA